MGIQLTVGGNYTVIYISGIAHTVRDEIIVTAQAPNDAYEYKLKGVRTKKRRLVKDDGSTLLFEGHGLPLEVDSDSGSFVANAMFNFVTEDPEALRGFINAKCLNPTKAKQSKTIYWPLTGSLSGNGHELFPEG